MMRVDLDFAAWCACVGISTPYVRVVGSAPQQPQEADACAGAAAAAAADGLAPPQATTHRSVVSKVALRRGDLIASIPDECVLTVTSSSIGHALTAAGLGNSAGPWREGVGLALALAAEATAGPSSRFAPYVAWLAAALPTLHATHPALWPPDQRCALLAGTAVGATLGRRASGAAARHAPAALAAAQRLAAAFMRRWPAAFSSRRPTTTMGFAEAYAIVAAYAFSLGADRIAALVPFWDALDHDPLSSAWVGGGGCAALSHDAQAGLLRMRARRAVPPGAPVFNYYGDVGPAQMVRRYGFAPPPASAAPDRVEAGPAEVGVAAVQAAAGRPGRRRVRVNAAIAAAAAAAGGRPTWADGETGRPSGGLLDAAAAAAAVVVGGLCGHRRRAARRVLAALAARRVGALKRGAVRAAACTSAPPGRAALAWVARGGETAAAVALFRWAGGGAPC